MIGIRQTTSLFPTIVELPKPLIVQAHGTLLGAGFQMAMCADLCIAGESARFSRAEQRIGFGGQDPFTNRRDPHLRAQAHPGAAAHRPRDRRRDRPGLGPGQRGRSRRRARGDRDALGRGIAAHATDGLVIGRQFHQITLSNMGFHQTYATSMLSPPAVHQHRVARGRVELPQGARQRRATSRRSASARSAGTTPAGSSVTREATGRASDAAVNWSLTAAEQAYRAEFRDWLAAEIRAPYLRSLKDRASLEFFGMELEFSRRLGEAGYLGVTTPTSLGGVGRSHFDQALI